MEEASGEGESRSEGERVMAKCECCGERSGDLSLGGINPWSAGLCGALHCMECWDMYSTGMGDRIRARRAEAEQSGDTIPAPPYFLAEPTGPREFKLAAPPPAAPECRECSRPERPIAATHGELCSYCSSRNRFDLPENHARMALVMQTSHGNPGARARMAAADRKAQPRGTAEIRMLALPHPWECDDV